MGTYDRTLKLLIDANPAAIARLALYAWQKQEPGGALNFTITSVTQLSVEFQSEEREADVVMLLEGPDGPFCLLELEVQSRRHPFMPLRSLEYCVRAKIKHWKEYGDLPILAVMLYLFDESNIPEPPLRWLAPDGQTIMVFFYLPISLKVLPREELLALQEPELWPLVLLTEGPVDRILVQKMFADLLERKLYRTLPICHTIAAWLLRGEDCEWLHQEYEKMVDLFQDSPALKWMEEDVTKRVTERITEQVTAQVTEQVTAQVTEQVTAQVTEQVTAQVTEQVRREERQKAEAERQRAEAERQRAEAERQKAVTAFRQTVTELVDRRFPELTRPAKVLVRSLAEPEAFQRLILHLSLARDAEEAQEALFALPEDGEQNEEPSL